MNDWLRSQVRLELRQFVNRKDMTFKTLLVVVEPVAIRIRAVELLSLILKREC